MTFVIFSYPSYSCFHNWLWKFQSLKLDKTDWKIHKEKVMLKIHIIIYMYHFVMSHTVPFLDPLSVWNIFDVFCLESMHKMSGARLDSIDWNIHVLSIAPDLNTLPTLSSYTHFLRTVRIVPFYVFFLI